MSAPELRRRFARLLRGFRMRLRDPRSRVHNFPAHGLNSEYRNDLEQGGGAEVVKGTARRVIVVKSPDPRIFEEAIFVIREDVFSERGVSAAKLMEEARQVASGFTGRRRRFRGLFSRLPAAAFAAIGSAATGIAWLAVKLLV